MRERLFVSYASRDAERVHRVVACLREHGLDVWLDQARIAAADDIVARIDEGLSDWRYFLLFASRRYFESAWATAEYRAAFYAAVGANERKIIVIRLDDAELPALIAGRKSVRYTTPETVAAEIARLMKAADITHRVAGGAGDEAPPISTARQTLDWTSAKDTVIQVTIKEILQRRGDLKHQRGAEAEFALQLDASTTAHVRVSTASLQDDVLWLDLSSELQNYAVVSKIAGSLRRRLLQGALGIFEGPFEVELEQRQLQLAAIRNTLVEQLAAVTRVEVAAATTAGDP